MATFSKYIASDVDPILNRNVPEHAKSLTKEQQQMLPYTTAGATGLQGIATLPMNENVGAETRGKNVPGSAPSIIMLNSAPSNAYAGNTPMTMAHEMEHALSFQGLGANQNVDPLNAKYDALTKPDGSISDLRGLVVHRLIKHAPYLVKNWGLMPDDAESGYFSDKYYKELSHPKSLLNEQFATLSALEQGKNKIFTDDPYVRENILTTPAQRETYNALTGLRQSRLDPRDLPPYTRVPEPGMIDKARKKIKDLTGYAAGGMVPQAGNNKLI